MTNQILINPDIYAMEDAGWPKPLFAFDMDSVLAMVTYLDVGLVEMFGPRLIEPDGIKRFKYKFEGVSNNKVYKAVHDLVGTEGVSALPTPFMYDVLKYYHELSGDPIVVVTARAAKNLDSTYQWLTNNLGDIPWYCAICHGVPKLPVLLDVGCDYFVDDRYKTIDSLQGHIYHPVLFQNPWNQGRAREASTLQIRDLRDLIPLFNIEFGLPPVTFPGNIPYPDRVGQP